MEQKTLSAEEKVNKIKEFLEENFKDVILSNIAKGEEAVKIEFNELSKFDIELAEELLEDPEDFFKAADYALDKLDFGRDAEIRLRFKEVPESSQIRIRNLRSKHLHSLFQMNGIVRQKTDVRPQMKSAKFECPSCGNVIDVEQDQNKFKKPSSCTCGRKGKFHLLSRELVDMQKIVLEESPEELEGGSQPKRINVYLRNDLVSPMSERRTNPGSKIVVTGVLKERPIKLRTGGKSTRFELQVEANNVEPVQEEFRSLELSDEEKEEIIEISKRENIYEDLIQSIAPTIYGHERIKEALVLQLFGGIRKTGDDGVNRRGDIHILLIGDPGAGKCLSSDTKIMLGDGTIREIGDVVEAEQFSRDTEVEPFKIPSMQLDGQSNHSHGTRYWKRDDEDELLKITTRSGKTLKVTKNHPLFTPNKGLITAAEAQDLETGDYIASPRKIDVEGTLQDLEPGKPKQYRNSKTYTYPEFLTSDLARLLGYLTGDGYVQDNDSSTWISFTSDDETLIQDFKHVMKTLFDADVTIRETKGSKEAYVISKAIGTFLEKNFNLKKKSREKHIPEKILKSPDEIVSEFLKGLFEADSHVNHEKSVIEYTTISEELADQLSFVLQRYGIVSTKKEKTKHATNTEEKREIKAYEVKIGPAFIENYAEIGYVTERKQNALKKIQEKERNTNLDIIPDMKTFLTSLRRDLGLKQKEMGIPRSTYNHYEQGTRNPSRDNLQKIYEEIERYDSPMLPFLKRIAHSDIYWDEIINVETIDHEGYVYDLEVNNTHNYYANGVVVHNSQLLQRVDHVAPKSRFVSGKGASGAGISASVIKDEFTNSWALEAGALILANEGLVAIDELDKMDTEDASAMHEALEQQQVTVSKANIHATLKAETTVLAAANPKFGRFDPYEVISKQIDLPSTLINRFDLIFPIKDLPDKEKDSKLASFILELHKDDDKKEGIIGTEDLKKYIGYAKQFCKPKLTEPALKEIKDYFVKMRNSGKEEEKVQSIPISARQLEGLIRLSEASARTRLGEKVLKKDAKKAIDLLHHCLQLIGFDEETGEFDIDRIATGITASQRNKISVVKDLIDELQEEVGKMIPMEDLIREAENQGVDEEKVEEIVQKLKRSGDLFSPRHGFISKI